MYKNTVRKHIKDWHTTVMQRKNQEWLILLVVRPDSRANPGGFFAMKSSVLDRIKADFNSGKRDRSALYTLIPVIHHADYFFTLIQMRADRLVSGRYHPSCLRRVDLQNEGRNHGCI